MSNTLLYTVCSANNLAHAKTMLDSFQAYHRDIDIFLVLVDEPGEHFVMPSLDGVTIITAKELQLPFFNNLVSRYTTIELNCAIKIFAAQFFLNQFSHNNFYYLDADILILDSIGEVNTFLLTNSFVITPHIISALPSDNAMPFERDILRSGIYNAGFMGFKRDENVIKIFEWWASHMHHECYYNFAEGMGVDQIWLNLLPILFKGVYIWNDPTVNVAYWNMHERNLTVEKSNYFVNLQPLKFVHISGFNPLKPDQISKHQNRYTLAEQPGWAHLLSYYTSLLMANGFEKYYLVPCFYAKKVKKSIGIMRFVNSILRPLGVKVTNT